MTGLNCVFMILHDDSERVSESIGVSYLMAVARQAGHQCTLVTARPNEVHGMLSKIVSLKPDFVGMSLLSGALGSAIVIGQQLRSSLGQSVHICAGGTVATYAGEMLLEHRDWYFLDSIVRGEGESVINKLLASISAQEPLYDIPGVFIRNHLGCADTIATPIAKLDSLPWPARDQLENSSPPMSVITVLTSRGCTGQCTFCAVMNRPGRNLHKGKVWRGRTPEDIVNEVEYLVSKYSANVFSFEASSYEDPMGGIGKQRIRRIAELILERGLKIYYGINTQAASWSTKDSDLLDLLYMSGLEAAYVGVESGSNRMLKIMKKRATVSDNCRALDLFNQHKIYAHFGLIMFHPYSEWQDIEENAAFILKYKGDQLIRYMTRLALYPGTEVVEQLKVDGLLESSYLENAEQYGYRYVNPAIGRMATSIVSMLYGEGRNPLSVRALRWLDLDLSVYISRILRAFHSNPAISEIIEDYEKNMDAERDALAKFNGTLWENFLACGKAGKDIPLATADLIEDRYSKAIKKLKSMQLKLGVNLGRLGIGIHTTRTEMGLVQIVIDRN